MLKKNRKSEERKSVWQNSAGRGRGCGAVPAPRPGLCPGSGTLLDSVCSRSGSSHSRSSAGALWVRSASGPGVPRSRAAPSLRMLLRGGVPGLGCFAFRALRGGLPPVRGCSSVGALRVGVRARRGARGTGFSGWARRPWVPGAARSLG